MRVQCCFSLDYIPNSFLHLSTSCFIDCCIILNHHGRVNWRASDEGIAVHSNEFTILSPPVSCLVPSTLISLRLIPSLIPSLVPFYSAQQQLNWWRRQQQQRQCNVHYTLLLFLMRICCCCFFFPIPPPPPSEPLSVESHHSLKLWDHRLLLLTGKVKKEEEVGQDEEGGMWDRYGKHLIHDAFKICLYKNKC